MRADLPHAATFERGFPRGAVLLLVLLSLGAHLWGIRMDLPSIPDVDEPLFVQPAIHMAATGDMNPHWFGNPGSTVIYPLAFIYRSWFWLTRFEPGFRPDRDLEITFRADIAPYYLVGRLLSVLYAVMCIPFVYLIGVRAFSKGAGLLGAWFSILYPLSVTQAQLLRTDAASTFFGLAGLYTCLELLGEWSLSRQIAAGTSTGLAIATKYYMGILVFLTLIVDAVVIAFGDRRHGSRKRDVGLMAAGLLAVVIALGVSSPYLVLDSAHARQDISVEARANHPGHDGLSLPGRLRWYVCFILFEEMGVLRYTLAGLGLLLAVWRGSMAQRIVATYVFLYLAGINVSSLHWQRWLIPILPILGLFAANTLLNAGAWALEHATWMRQHAALWFTLVVAAISFAPAREIVLMDIRQSRPGTRILMRQWVLANVSPGTCIAHEEYTAPLEGTDYSLIKTWKLPEQPPSSYLRRGCRLFMTSSSIYDRYFRQPDRYAAEVAFYRRLFREGSLRAEFAPDEYRNGPDVRLYEWEPR